MKIFLFIFTISSIICFSDTIPQNILEKIKIRNIGPAGMSGRVTSIDVTGYNKDLIYVGTASGGLWRSKGGIKWEQIFDDAPTQAIGSVKIEPNNSDVIWVGTGEGNPRNSISSGNGIYKSIDGGKTWQNKGLEKSRNIHKIVIDKNNPETVYLGVIGNPWVKSEDRGVYKTTNGGETWEKSLYLNDSAGCADLAIDKSNPNKLIAAMWEHQRKPWFFNSGGKQSGIYITYNGGKNWKKVTKGLPTGDLGRIGLTISESKPNIVYAIVESAKNAIYRSEDGGESWTKQSESGNIGNRPFYYNDIHCDPKNENRVWSLWTLITKSEDAGKNWDVIVNYSWNSLHPDHHSMWMDSDNPDYIIEGNDGGLNITRDGGKTWRFIENIPVAQFYHINYDTEIPYNVYGGMQDNGSWVGPSQVWRSGGIRNYYWEELAFGDGFDVVPDKFDNNYGYAMSQEGHLVRYELKTGNQNYIRPVHPDGLELRFNWNAGIAHDNFNTKTIYYGSQFLHKSTDRGENWEIISPDLTSNDTNKLKQSESGGITIDATGAENHCTILSIAPSEIEDGLIWVGTDDGQLQLTKDGGKSWQNMINSIPNAPKGAWIPQIVPSTFNKGECFVVINNYRQGDWKPYLFHTTDYGKTWVNLVEKSQIPAYTLSFAQDLSQKNLMFVGTEFGLYFSIDAGKNWQKWSKNYPSVPTIDLKIHPREKELIVGTFGRAAWIFDDIEILRELAKENKSQLKDSLQLFDTKTSYIVEWREASGQRFTADALFYGENSTSAAVFSYNIIKPKSDKKLDSSKKEESENKLSLDSANILIYNSRWEKIKTYKLKIDSGLNKFTWGHEAKGVRWPQVNYDEKNPDKEYGDKMIEPGKYNIVLNYNEKFDTIQHNVKYDPRKNYDEKSYLTKIAKQEELFLLVEKVTDLMDNLRNYEKSIKNIESNYELLEQDSLKSIKEKIKVLKDSLKSIKSIVIFDSGEKQGIFRDPDVLLNNLYSVNYYITNSLAEPSRSVDYLLKKCEIQKDEFKIRLNNFIKENSKLIEEFRNLKLNLIKDLKIIE